MVAADPEHRPAVVIGFSLGCKIAKYLLHWCHSQKGNVWMNQNVAHFVALGGPFRGSVDLQKAVMIDGAFPPLDMIFTESEMLTIFRSVPVGRYLQPTGDWEDGLDIPFIFLRDELYVKVRIGPLRMTSGSKSAEQRLRLNFSGTEVFCKQTLSFHCEQPFVESIGFAVSPRDVKSTLCIPLLHSSKLMGTASFKMDLQTPIGTEQNATLQLHCGESSAEQEVFGFIQLKYEVVASEKISQYGNKHMAQLANHPLSQHRGGHDSKYRAVKLDCVHNRGFCPTTTAQWNAANPVAVQNYAGMQSYNPDNWLVPAPNGRQVSELSPPPVAKCTAIYGVNMRTPRTMFLKHPAVTFSGGKAQKLKPSFEFDKDGDVDGLLVIDGVGYETA